jgi:hypothetical protein
MKWMQRGESTKELVDKYFSVNLLKEIPVIRFDFIVFFILSNDSITFVLSLYI